MGPAVGLGCDLSRARVIPVLRWDFRVVRHRRGAVLGRHDSRVGRQHVGHVERRVGRVETKGLGQSEVCVERRGGADAHAVAALDGDVHIKVFEAYRRRWRGRRALGGGELLHAVHTHTWRTEERQC